jgi:transposase
LLFLTCLFAITRHATGGNPVHPIDNRSYGWYAPLVCEITIPEPLPVSGHDIGVDVGVSSFAVLGNGKELENLRNLSEP